MASIEPESHHRCTRTPLIPEYFAGRHIFITGATGFLGKVLVERLLWTCPKISSLHILMRSKKNLDPEQRLKDLKQCPVFDVIRQHYPERLEKLSVIAGDITKHMFNLDGNALHRLRQVSVVIHSAATIKFDEPLPAALDQNVHSVNNIMEICDQLPMMEVLIYVSTAYSNAELSSIEERVYPAPTDLQIVLAFVDTVCEQTVIDATPKLISPKPNTYTFTKAIAESLIAERARTSNYATAIFRPSIVVSSLQNPFPGWIDNLNGPSGILVAGGKGLLHIAQTVGTNRADMIPVDIVVDTLIAVVWEVGIENFRETRVYNCSSYENPVTWFEFRCHTLRCIRKNPFNATLWYPFFFLTNNKFLFIIARWFLETAPLHTFGYFQKIFKVKQRRNLSTICHRMHVATNAFKFFTTRQWEFSTKNVKRLRARLAPPDAAVYNLDPQTIDWETHCADSVKGLRKYFLKESDTDLQKAQIRIRFLRILHGVVQCLLIFLVYKLMFSIQWFAHI